MTRFRRGPAVAALTCLLVLGARSIATADISPIWSQDQLVDFSQAVLTGRVSAIASAWDPSVSSIYTYVTIDVDEVLKGAVGRTLVLKQGGGIVGEIGLDVSGQARFAIGEEVLVFAEVRPRDATLYTSALWQGKWSIETDEATGARYAVLRDPEAASREIRRQPLEAVMQQIAAQAGQAASVEAFDAIPEETPAAGTNPYVLLMVKWLSTPISVDIQAGGQPGLAGAGLAQLQNVFAQWNATTGSNFQYVVRTTNAASRCQSPFANSGVLTIIANDPCAETSNSGGVLAVAQTWFTTTVQQVFNGVGFRRTLEVIITTNDSATAQQFVTNANCYQQVLLHEVGHSVGLDHSADPSAVMTPSVSFSQCSASPRPLQPDDIAGIQFIYGAPTGGTPPASAPTGLSVTVNGTASITVSFNAVSGATTYRLDFRQTVGGPVLAQVPTSTTTTVIPLPPGISGAFNVTATAVNAAGAGPPSAAVPFTIGGGPGCTAAPASPQVSGGIVAGTATVTWPQVPGATSYIFSAGTTAGSANLVPLTNIGTTNVLQATGLPAGFQAFVRVIAVNACGQSAPTDFLVR